MMTSEEDTVRLFRKVISAQSEGPWLSLCRHLHIDCWQSKALKRILSGFYRIFAMTYICILSHCS